MMWSSRINFSRYSAQCWVGGSECSTISIFQSHYMKNAINLAHIYTHTHTHNGKSVSLIYKWMCVTWTMTNWEYNAFECSLSRDLNFIITWEIHFTKINHGKKNINKITYNQSILYVHHKTSLSSARWSKKNIYYIMPHVMKKNEEQMDKFPWIINRSTRSW